VVVAAVIDARWWWLVLLGVAVVAIVWSVLVAGLCGVRRGGCPCNGLVII